MGMTDCHHHGFFRNDHKQAECKDGCGFINKYLTNAWKMENIAKQPWRVSALRRSYEWLTDEEIAEIMTIRSKSLQEEYDDPRIIDLLEKDMQKDIPDELLALLPDFGEPPEEPQ